MSKPAKQKYKTKNWAPYTKALRARGSLTMWLDRDMAWQGAPASGKPGRPATYSDAAVQCCLTMKVLFGLALRQTQGFVQSVLGLSGLDWQAPDYSTMSRREKRLTDGGDCSAAEPRRTAPAGGLDRDQDAGRG